MRTPSFKELKAQASGGYSSRSYARAMHANPRLYKYLWWVFWRDSPVDGQAFLDQRFALGTASAMHLLALLEQQQLCYWVYNRRLPRLQPGVTPFDPLHPRWSNTPFAPALDDDADPLWRTYR